MAAAAPRPEPAFDRVAYAQRILHAEAAAITLAASRVDQAYLDTLAALENCRGRVVVIGVGKSADIGQKLVGTFNSTGTRAYLLDATRAVHGDLGAVAPEDTCLLLSHSGESEELLRLLHPLRTLTTGLYALTGNGHSSLARGVDSAIVYGPITEACPLALAPSASTTVMLALGDSLAFALVEIRRFSREDFAKFHPAGSLGKRLASVASAMRTGVDLRMAHVGESLQAVFANSRHAGRRSGAIMLLDQGKLAGLFTDSDLARLIEAGNFTAFSQPIDHVMTRCPISVTPDVRLVEAVELMRSKKISELPVVDSAGVPVGLLDITDLLGIVPPPAEGGSRPQLKLFGQANQGAT